MPSPGRLYRELWHWSVREPAEFWNSIWDYFGVLGDKGWGRSWPARCPRPSWFGGGTLNYARNALRHASSAPDRIAVRYSAETGRAGALTYAELSREVARVRAGLRALGVTTGDRVAAYLPNSPEALIAMLATASLGAIWSSCSPDFGAHSVIDRFAQISPQGAARRRRLRLRRQEVRPAARAGGDRRRSYPAWKRWSRSTTSAPGQRQWTPARVPVTGWAELGADAGAAEPEFAEVPFDHPLWVLYSSGTTGLPKPIVHGHGGIVLEHLKALGLHQDLGRGGHLLLVHHDRLDDVELPGRRPARGRDRGALRRQRRATRTPARCGGWPTRPG